MKYGKRYEITVRAAFRMDRIHTAERIRELENRKVKAICPKCRVTESREHLITKCIIYKKERKESEDLAKSLNILFSEQFVLAPEQIPTITDIPTIEQIYTTTNKMLHKIYDALKRRYKRFRTKQK